MMSPLLLIGLYAVSALAGIGFVLYVYRILSVTSLVGDHPRSWLVLAVGMAMVATSSLFELFFVANPRLVVFNAFNVYFAVGNVLVLLVLIMIWRRLE